MRLSPVDLIAHRTVRRITFIAGQEHDKAALNLLSLFD